jgi:hypothetical protein
LNNTSGVKTTHPWGHPISLPPLNNISPHRGPVKTNNKINFNRLVLNNTDIKQRLKADLLICKV